MLVSSILLAPSAAGAQSADGTPRRPSVSLDATVGGSNGHSGGEYRNDGRGMSADVLLAVGFGGAAGGRILAGLNGNVHETGTTSLICQPPQARDCVPAFPEFQLVGAVVGWESGNSRFRAAAGPASARASGEWSEWRLAWQGRLDGAVPLARHVAAVTSVRGALVPAYRGDSVRLLALGLGLRIH
ncbi:MAG: hypothetical protein ACYC2G_16575 [Gemmatimonadaceae bacterium]